jgi:hypothetical protein
LIVAVKDNCLGCAEFMAEPSLDGWNLLLVARNDIPHAPQVLVSTEAFALFDIRSEPFFVALDGEPLMIVTEGVPFSLSHTLEQLPQ